MELERFYCEKPSLLKSGARGHASRKIRKLDAVVALRILPQERDVLGHVFFLSRYWNLSPDWRSMLRSVPAARSFFG
jgi:hypothetical protein